MNLHVSHVWLQQWKASSHPPSTICLFPISPSLSLPLQTLRLVSLVSLITKTKRIPERSDTNCDTHTHTHTHTHRKSTLEKYMIKKWAEQYSVQYCNQVCGSASLWYGSGFDLSPCCGFWFLFNADPDADFYLIRLFTLMRIRIKILASKWKKAQKGSFSIHFGLSYTNWWRSGSGSRFSWSLWCIRILIFIWCGCGFRLPKWCGSRSTTLTAILYIREQTFLIITVVILLFNVFDLFCLVHCVWGLVPRSPPGAGKWSTQGQVTRISFFQHILFQFIANFLYLYMTAWSAASHIPSCWMY